MALLPFLKENALKLSIGGLYRKLKLQNSTAAQNKALGWIGAAGERRRASRDVFVNERPKTVAGFRQPTLARRRRGGQDAALALARDPTITSPRQPGCEDASGRGRAVGAGSAPTPRLL